ncbi:hypothetical protein FKW77_010609 [Venturia effusa]|uniref:Protein kinase domain-containing protein n=1 Tax=Venturia effusa TaxID=50376 RepID=A0A517KXY2_9PEZI|nr:hypothetical protein FKW77_010609 [Venturia effusa]
MERQSQQEEPTQLTQQVLDPRRLGRNNSGLRDADISDVLCILHPCSPAAFRIVASTAARRPQHVLQNSLEDSFEDLTDSWQLEEQETFIVRNQVGDNAKDLALRLSSKTIQPILGFCFGRNPRSCDIVIDVDSVKRVSNLHFRIFVNQEGVLMLEDMSTNGTMVDATHLKGKNSPLAATRMLQNGSIIQIPSSKPDESVKFIVRTPNRQGYELEFQRKLEHHVGQRLELERIHNEAQGKQQGRQQDQPLAQPAYRFKGSVGISHSCGMQWDGGEKYNVVGQLGKGAFAIVYKLATKRDGHFFAAKELEKKRFIKNGRLDQRLDNELQIMKSITHPNVVQYIGYHDYVDHLYIIMEYVPCGDMQGYLSKHTYLSEAEAKIMSRQVLEALRYLHSKQITHRDIKPDNILISSQDPFTVKLSDFGLSKVVNSNQTFLKTFCGTLLYCAPEVFPHYDEHVQKKGIKRRRTGSSQDTNFHQYSQSVDIWSYAAVLWLSLCGKPPFEGVVDATGKGMFHKIMETNLDISPLLARGITRDAIDLLCRMLTTDPSLRPTEIECLNHKWLFNGTLFLPVEARGLRAISEEDDEVTAGEKFSQLSVQDPEAFASDSMMQLEDVTAGGYFSGSEEVKFDSGDLDFLDPRQSKRMKADLHFPQLQEAKDQAALYTALDTSSPNFNSQRFVAAQQGEDDWPTQDCDPNPYVIASQELESQKKQPRLFGEIGASALKSSGLLGTHTTAALATTPAELNPEPVSQDYEMGENDADNDSHRGQRSSEVSRMDGHKMKDPSLLGAESLVRDLNMESPGLATSPGAPSDLQSNGPKTPGSPGSSSHHSTGSQLQMSSFEITPRAKKPENRQVPLDEGAANFLFHGNSTLLRTQEGNHSDMVSIAHSANDSQDSDSFNGKKGLPPSSALPIWIASEVSSPKPGLGKLTTTTDSFFSSCLRIEKDNRVSHWGRDPLNTFVHPNKQDTRIPKRAIELHFHAYGIEKELKTGRDWTAMSGISTVIHTLSRAGIWVNNVKLDSNDKDGAALCGHLYTGDVITIFRNKEMGNGPESLRFVCEFYVGEAASRRPADRPFKAVRATK